MSCRWLNSVLRNKSHAYAITIAFFFGRELRQACRCVAIYNKIKNLLIRREEGEENQ